MMNASAGAMRRGPGEVIKNWRSIGDNSSLFDAIRVIAAPFVDVGRQERLPIINPNAISVGQRRRRVPDELIGAVMVLGVEPANHWLVDPPHIPEVGVDIEHRYNRYFST